MSRPPALSGVWMCIFSCNLRNPAPQGRSPRVSIHALYDCRAPSAANHPHRARVQLPAGPIVRSDQGLSRAFRIIFRLSRRLPMLAESALAFAPAPSPTQTSQDGASHASVGNHKKPPAKRTQLSQHIRTIQTWCAAPGAPAGAGPLRHLSPDCPRFNSLFHGFLGREPPACREISAPATTSPLSGRPTAGCSANPIYKHIMNLGLPPAAVHLLRPSESSHCTTDAHQVTRHMAIIRHLIHARPVGQ